MNATTWEIDPAAPPTPMMMRAERFELRGKIGRLQAFQHGSIFPQMPADEQQRIHQQVQAMRVCLAFLDARLAALPPDLP